MVRVPGWWAPLVLAAMLGAAPAAAAVTIGPAPGGWTEQEVLDSARRRAQGWADRAGGTLVRVLSTRDRDDYAEVIALLELPSPADADAYSERGEQVLTDTCVRVLGAEGRAESFESRPQAGAPPLLLGRFVAGDAALHVALASSGTTQSLLVMSVDAEESALYAPAFAGLADTLSGIAPPAVPFPRATWRILSIVAAAVFAGVTTFAFARRTQELIPTARRVAMTCAIAAAIVIVGAWLAIGDAAGTGASREWIAAELALPLWACAAIAIAIAIVATRMIVPVQMAPKGGVWAEPRSSVQIPIVPQEVVEAVKAGKRPWVHPDGVSTLQPAHDGEPDEIEDAPTSTNLGP